MIAEANVVSTSRFQDRIAVWQRWQTSFEADRGFDHLPADVDFTLDWIDPDGNALSSPGYWDGGATFRACMAFPRTGVWRWRTRCTPEVPGLTGKSGTVRVSAYRGSSPLYRHGWLRVSDDRRHLCHADGSPFLWIGDTAWAGPMRASDTDWKDYLRDRIRKRFTLVQVGPASDWMGATDAMGVEPFDGDNVLRPIPAFWQGWERRIRMAIESGMAVLIVGLSEPRTRYPAVDDAWGFARWLMARLYGDPVMVSPSFDSPWMELADTIGRRLAQLAPHHLVTQHPGTPSGQPGHIWAERYYSADYLAYAGCQTGHNNGRLPLCFRQATGWIQRLYRMNPTKPVINLEAIYETDESPAYSAHSARGCGYLSMLSGAAGYTYGSDLYVWHTDPSKPDYWRRVLARPGTLQMGVMRSVWERAGWPHLKPSPDFVANNPADLLARCAAAIHSDERTALVYLPQSCAVRLQSGWEQARGIWISPLTGRNVPASGAVVQWAPPAEGDWVLQLKR